MAEFINQKIDRNPDYEDAMNNMGHPVPKEQRGMAYDHCKQMGLNSADAMSCVSETAEQLERDKPYEAQGRAMKYLDITGAYRIFAVLLTHVKPPKE